jgi:peptidoglycan/xylan/chitin deacetylase (PgdA/CDA1 family)
MVVAHRHGAGERVVALTFDDGPSQWTDPMLDVLQAHQAQATFFVLGSAVTGRSDVVERIVREGHELGNHTFSHPRLSTLGDAEIRSQLETAQEAILTVSGVAPRFWRPPHFDYDERVQRVAADVGLGELIHCSVYPQDYIATADEIVERVLEALRPGSIVDLHDGRPDGEAPNLSAPTREATLQALGEILEALGKDGYRAVTVSQLLAAR